jgi:hypothetical protein
VTRRPRRLRGPRRPPLTVRQILAWADSHRARTGSWPTADSGYVHGNRNEKWSRIDGALRLGLRDLRGGSSLARLLAGSGASGTARRCRR